MWLLIAGTFTVALIAGAAVAWWRRELPLEVSQQWLGEHRADYGGHRD